MAYTQTSEGSIELLENYSEVNYPSGQIIGGGQFLLKSISRSPSRNRPRKLFPLKATNFSVTRIMFAHPVWIAANKRDGSYVDYAGIRDQILVQRHILSSAYSGAVRSTPRWGTLNYNNMFAEMNGPVAKQFESVMFVYSLRQLAREWDEIAKKFMRFKPKFRRGLKTKINPTGLYLGFKFGYEQIAQDLKVLSGSYQKYVVAIAKSRLVGKRSRLVRTPVSSRENRSYGDLHPDSVIEAYTGQQGSVRYRRTVINRNNEEHSFAGYLRYLGVTRPTAFLHFLGDNIPWSFVTEWFLPLGRALDFVAQQGNLLSAGIVIEDSWVSSKCKTIVTSYTPDKTSGDPSIPSVPVKYYAREFSRTPGIHAAIAPDSTALRDGRSVLLTILALNLLPRRSRELSIDGIWRNSFSKLFRAPT